MSLHSDLLTQAKHLASREPRRPRQASLRRAISAAYYSLFHLLISESVKCLLGGSAKRENLRACLARAFSHGAMKDAATGFANRKVSPKISPALAGVALQPELVSVANAFVDLQQARHEADYDLRRRFTRTETQDLVERADKATKDWHTIRRTMQAEAFLVALLAQKQMQS